MANPVWPTTLPIRFEADQYEESEPDLLLRTKMDTIAENLRLRTRAGVAPISGTISMTTVQRQQFAIFYRVTCNYGALPFDWQTQMGYGDVGLVPDMATLTDPALLLDGCTYRFVGPPKYRNIAPNQWAVMLRLERMPPVTGG